MELAPGARLEHLRLPVHLRDSLERLWADRPAEPGLVKIMGRTLPTPRLFQSYGQPYRFSGVDHPAVPVTPELARLVEWAGAALGVEFNQVLVNWYRDGHDYIGRHADDETQIEPGTPIVTISLGATRKFRVRRDGAVVHDHDMRHGDVLVMCGEFQRALTHEVVKVGGAKGRAAGRRVSVTLRRFAE